MTPSQMLAIATVGQNVVVVRADCQWDFGPAIVTYHPYSEVYRVTCTGLGATFATFGEVLSYFSACVGRTVRAA